MAVTAIHTESDVFVVFSCSGRLTVTGGTETDRQGRVRLGMATAAGRLLATTTGRHVMAVEA